MTVSVPARFCTEAAGRDGSAVVDPGLGKPTPPTVAVVGPRNNTGTGAIRRIATDRTSVRSGVRYRFPRRRMLLGPDAVGTTQTADGRVGPRKTLPTASKAPTPAGTRNRGRGTAKVPTEPHLRAHTATTTRDTPAMCVTRRTVLQRLAEATDAERRETTTVDALVSTLGADEPTVVEHIDALVACDLAHVEGDGSVRVTITGEELLALDADEVTIVDPARDDATDA